jgi:hypothetical protein
MGTGKFADTEPAPVRRELEVGWHIAEAREGVEQLAGADRPHFHFLPPAHGNRLAVVRDGALDSVVFGALEPPNGLASTQVPDPKRPLAHSANRPIPVSRHPVHINHGRDGADHQSRFDVHDFRGVAREEEAF